MIESGIAAALKDPDHQFNRTEIAYLMSVAYRWGYEHRVDEENGLVEVGGMILYGGLRACVADVLRERQRWARSGP